MQQRTNTQALSVRVRVVLNQVLINLRENARHEAEQYLESLLDGGFSRLAEKEVPEVRLNVAAWKGMIECGAEQVEIILALPQAFPDQLPNIYLVDIKTLIPHVTSTRANHLCYADPQAAFPLPDGPALIIQDALKLASKTIMAGLTGSNQTDFTREFEAYWGDQDTYKWISLVTPGGRPRVITRLILTDEIDGANSILGENDDQSRQWLANAKPGSSRPRSSESLYLPLQLAFKPPFPATNKDIYKLLSEIDPGALLALCDFLTSNKERTENHVLFSVPVGGHYAFGGWIHSRPHKKKKEPICKGFRDVKVTGKVQLTTCFPSQLITRATATRADPIRLQARVGSGKAASLFPKTVLVIGCGSIGCRIANLLALEGVGKLILIDNDHFHVENMARHVLPAYCLGSYKAKSLANLIKAQSPHLEVTPHHEDLYKIISERPELICNNDLVVAATGDKNLEFRLNNLLTNGHEPRPAIYAWTEAQGIASHALLTVPGGGGCLRCAYEAGEENDLIFRYAVDTRLASKVLLNEEGCGSTFQPFSALVADQAAIVAARMALAYLHGDIGSSSRWHRLGDLKSAREQGLPISNRYKKNVGDELLKIGFARHSNCPACTR